VGKKVLKEMLNNQNVGAHGHGSNVDKKRKREEKRKEI